MLYLRQKYDIMKKALLLSFALVFTLTASAIPAKRYWTALNQSDGTQVTLMLVGDENFHYYQTTDYKPVMQANDHSYVYAEVRGGQLIPTTQLAHDVAQRSEKERQLLQTLNNDDVQINQARAASLTNTMPRKVGEPKVYTGQKKGLIILVSFSDLDFTTGDETNAIWSDIANKEGYNERGAIGSVHDYFYDQSSGLFDLTFDVVGPYKASKSVTYYGQNSGSSDNGTTVRELIRFACSSASYDVNLADYDWDGDKEVDQVFILYAGFEESTVGNPSYCIWPHESSLGRYALTFNGYKMNTYACGGELQGTEGATLSGLGTFCHEFSHCLGLPDFYDTASNHSGGVEQYAIGTYDIMAAGSYNSDSWVPAGYTGYEKNFCGWLEYRELTDPCKVTKLKNINEGGESYVIYNPNNRNEYYLLENRAKKGWDKGIYGTGLLVVHVNYIRSRWTSNTPNTQGEGERCMVIIPANNDLSYTGESGMPWPRGTNTTLSDTSTPAAILYTPNTDGQYLMHCKLKVVKTNGGLITFYYNDGTQEWSDLTAIHDVNSTPADMMGSEVYIYNAQGAMVDHTTHYAGVDHLPRGLYVVKAADGTTLKTLSR